MVLLFILFNANKFYFENKPIFVCLSLRCCTSLFDSFCTALPVSIKLEISPASLLQDTSDITISRNKNIFLMIFYSIVALDN